MQLLCCNPLLSTGSSIAAAKMIVLCSMKAWSVMGGDEPINLRTSPVKHNHYLQLSHDRICVDWFYICIIRIAERALSHTVHETCMHVTRAHRPVQPFLVSVRQGNVGKDSFFIEVVADFLFSFNEEVFLELESILYPMITLGLLFCLMLRCFTILFFTT